MANKGFFCMDDYLKKTAKLTDEELGRLFRALMVYHATGESADLDGRESIAYDFIKDDIDAAAAAYQAKCDTNRQNRRAGQSETTVVNDRPRSSTIVNDRQRPSTNDDERQRTMTNDDETHNRNRKRNINININNNTDDDDDDDDDSRGRARAYTRESIIQSSFLAFCGRKPTKEEAKAIQIAGNLCETSDELLAHAIRLAAANGAKNVLAYVRKILDEWREQAVTTVDEYEQYKFMVDAAARRNDGWTDDINERMEAARQERIDRHERERSSA